MVLQKPKVRYNHAEEGPINPDINNSTSAALSSADAASSLLGAFPTKELISCR
jgi:hypothetical protein